MIKDSLLKAMVLAGVVLLTSTRLAAGEIADRLVDTDWYLIQFQSMDDAIGTQRPQDPARYSMRLNADGTVIMQLNCNLARGRWSVDPGGSADSGRFEFGPLATTRALCPPPSMDQKISADAKYVRSYLIKDDRLYLSLMADAGIYAWARDTSTSKEASIFVAAEDGGPRNWEVRVSSVLNLRQQPSTGARILHRFKSGTILDNLGCQPAEQRTWCDVQPLGGGPRGYVAAEFLQPARSPDGRVAKGLDDSALRAGQGSFDARGTIPCAQALGQPMTQCTFGVARAGGGYATVVVNRPNGRSRVIFFRMGTPIGAETSQADGYADFRVSRENDLHRIRIGNERYEIPDAVIFGG